MRIAGFHVDGFGGSGRPRGRRPLPWPCDRERAERGRQVDAARLPHRNAVRLSRPPRQSPIPRACPGRAPRRPAHTWPKAAPTSRTTTGNGEIERYAGPHKLVSIRRPDGASASEEDLRRALGGADEALFRAVFAVDLTELGRPESVTRDDVRELLFSASIVGQRRSAARAMGDLQQPAPRAGSLAARRRSGQPSAGRTRGCPPQSRRSEPRSRRLSRTTR